MKLFSNKKGILVTLLSFKWAGVAPKRQPYNPYKPKRRGIFRREK